MRGKATVQNATNVFVKGSPPRMRGKDPEPHWRAVPAGITPAYAGKRRQGRISTGSCQDHPRVCGEKPQTVPIWNASTGSPPRMRGKGDFPALALCHVRITPAYAGKSYRRRSWPSTGWDHPRVCGEKGLKINSKRQKAGSPPRMRGKARSYAQLHYKPRITPAYAGKSEQKGGSPVQPGDHPRACGEKIPATVPKSPI